MIGACANPPRWRSSTYSASAFSSPIAADTFAAKAPRRVGVKLGVVGADDEDDPLDDAAVARLNARDGHFIQEQKGPELGRIVAEFIATTT
jgi:hypothetical protein